MFSPPQVTPVRLNLKKDAQLEIDWADGTQSIYPIDLLRTMCPCAQCKTVREGSNPHDISPGPKRKPLLTILPGDFSKPLAATSAQLVGNYALQIEWSDGHGSGIYSFQYLREIAEGNNRQDAKTPR